MIGHRFAHDLAASTENAVCERFFSAEQDALKQSWVYHLGTHQFGWLNPPFARISPWVEKCDEEAEQGARIAVLLPASVGTDWFAKHVAGKAAVLFLRPRLTFGGEKDPYPKDLMLCLYDGPRTGYAPWDWKGGTR